MSCSLCKCPWKSMPKHPGENQCCSPRRGIRTTPQQAGEEKSATHRTENGLSETLHSTAVSGASADSIDCRLGRSSLLVSACHKAFLNRGVGCQGHVAPGRALLSLASTDLGGEAGGSPCRTPRGIFLYRWRGAVLEPACFGMRRRLRMCHQGRPACVYVDARAGATQLA